MKAEQIKDESIEQVFTECTVASYHSNAAKEWVTSFKCGVDGKFMAIVSSGDVEYCIINGIIYRNELI